MQGFVHNNRGINDESDFNPKLLEELYLNIQQQSLRVPVNAQLPTAGDLPRLCAPACEAHAVDVHATV